MIRKVTTILPVILCGAGLLAATVTGSSPAGATSAPRAGTAKKECQVKFTVKGTDGETHADIIYDYEFDNGGANKSPSNVKLPWTFTTPRRVCTDFGISADLEASNHAQGAGRTYTYIYSSGSLVAEGFAYGDSSSASSTYQLNGEY
jgi:hypothetical protein